MRKELLAAGLLREYPTRFSRPNADPVLHLDDAGRAAAARHCVEGQWGAIVMPFDIGDAAPKFSFEPIWDEVQS